MKEFFNTLEKVRKDYDLYRYDFQVYSTKYDTYNIDIIVDNTHSKTHFRGDLVLHFKLDKQVPNFCLRLEDLPFMSNDTIYNLTREFVHYNVA